MSECSAAPEGKFDEPWAPCVATNVHTVLDHRKYNRARLCVNLFAGIEDPEKELLELRAHREKSQGILAGVLKNLVGGCPACAMVAFTGSYDSSLRHQGCPSAELEKLRNASSNVTPIPEPPAPRAKPERPAICAAFRYDDPVVSTYTPAGYRCTMCGISGVRLYRESHTLADQVKLRCRACACNELGREPTPGPEHSFGHFVAAVPTEDGETFWGYTSVPDAGVRWWDSLPKFDDIPF